MEDPSFFQDDNQSAQPQPAHSGEFPNPQDYYSQDDDWRAQQPFAWEGEFLDSQDRASTKPDIKSPALVDTWQNEGMANCMMAWTAHDQGAGTVNPKDLFQASV